jgi:LDH2 family malate/lactate/ureidoglycolate dehydrogenase
MRVEPFQSLVRRVARRPKNLRPAAARVSESLSTSGVLWTASRALERAGLPVFGLWPLRRVRYETLVGQVAALLRGWGMAGEHAAITAEHLLYADLHGIDSHGCAMIPEYHKGMAANRLTMTPTVSIVREGPTTALVDGGGGLGHVPADFAMRLAIIKCREAGVGVVTVRNSGHYGSAGSYAAMASAVGLVGIATTNCRTPAVVPTRGVEAMLGTNPIACAAPTDDGARPFLLDMSTSTVPVGRLMTELRRGRALPEGWALDRSGLPVTSARRALSARRLTPLGATPQMGSHKGYGLATMVELLSSTLPGLRAAQDGTDRVGHFFLVIDPDQFGAAGEFETALGAMVDELRRSKPVNAGEPVLVAGDPEQAARAERTRTGIPLSRFVIEEIRSVCRASNVPFLLDSTAG